MDVDDADGDSRAAYLPFVGAAALVAVLVTLVLTVGGGSDNAAGTLRCPETYRHPSGQQIWVPSGARKIDTTRRLVPDRTPAQAFVCYYRVPNARTDTERDADLLGVHTLSGSLATVRSSLSTVTAGGGGACNASLARTDFDDYLVGLTYSTGTVWVSVPGEHCLGASNGEFVTATNLRSAAATAYRTGHWPAT